MPTNGNFKHYHDYKETSVDKYPYFIESNIQFQNSVNQKKLKRHFSCAKWIHHAIYI